MADLNPECPFCGKEELVAVVDVIYCRVPLGSDGYSAWDGSIVETSVYEVACNACKRIVRLEHYESHGDEPCDCVAYAKTVEANTAASLEAVEVATALEQGRKAAGA